MRDQSSRLPEFGRGHATDLAPRPPPTHSSYPTGTDRPLCATAGGFVSIVSDTSSGNPRITVRFGYTRVTRNGRTFFQRNLPSRPQSTVNNESTEREVPRAAAASAPSLRDSPVEVKSDLKNHSSLFTLPTS